MLLHRIQEMKLWKKKYIWVYLAAVILGLMVCLVFCLQSRQSISCQGMYTFEPGQAADKILYEGISLKPGVYRIGLQYQTDKDYSGMCTAIMETDNSHALLTNGEHLYAGLGSTGYQLWLLEPTEDLQILVSYSGEGTLSAKDLVIVNTGQLWTMIAVLLSGFAALGLVLMVYAAYDKCYGVTVETKLVIAFITIITVAASWSQLRNSMLGGADLTYHLQRIEGVKDGLSTGQFPVRIEPGWLYNHGYADAVFYCNTFLYLPAVLRMAGFSVTISYNLFCIALNLATAWISWYVFTRIFKDYRIGLMCSALYTLSFHRIYKLAIMGAVGEGSAMTFLPLVFYGLYRIFTEEPRSEQYKTAWLPVALGYAGVIQCHVLTCEITVLVTLVIVVVSIRKVLQKEVFVELAKGALGAAGLSLWYLIPFLDYFFTQNMHIRHVFGRTIQERGLYPFQLLLNSWSDSAERFWVERGLEEIEAGCVGTLFVVALLVFVGLWLFGRLKNLPEALRRAGKFSAVMACVLMFMALRIFPWNRLQENSGLLAPLVSSIQFPHRFLSWGTVFLCVVSGTCMYVFCHAYGEQQMDDKTYRGHGRRTKIGYIVGTVLVAVSVLTSSFSLLHHALREQTRYMLHNEESMGCGYISGAEYLVEGTDAARLTFAGPVPGEGVQADGYAKSGLNATVYCRNAGEAESYVDLPILLYKGYHAYLADGSEAAVCAGDNHLVRVKLPAGYEGELQVRFESPLYWRLGELVTVITAVVVIAAGLGSWKRKYSAAENADFNTPIEGARAC